MDKYDEFLVDVHDLIGFDQYELNDLVRDLGLSKKATEILSSRRSEKLLQMIMDNVMK